MAATSNGYKSHEERTAVEPRRDLLHRVTLSHVQQVNKSIRLLRLAVNAKDEGVEFLPGQWLDVFAPGIKKAGGFTITSTPQDAAPVEETSPETPFIELAVQYSLSNPPAAWLWQPEKEILDQQLAVRVGGSFVWPPAAGTDIQNTRLILVAGGVGINPLMSILSSIHASKSAPKQVLLLYSTKAGEPQKGGMDVLFYSRIKEIASNFPSELDVRLHLTGANTPLSAPGPGISVYSRRIHHSDLDAALGPYEQRKSAICYVCGPPPMTDSFVDFLKSAPGVDPDRVLCEKWW